jgi:hypothetical protein
MSGQKPRDPDAGKVIGGKFVLPSGNMMQASCHHRKAGACGGCYARFYVLIDDVEAVVLADPAEALRLIVDLGTRMKAESGR